MFTGLIQAVGTVAARAATPSGARLTLDVGGLARRPEVGASVAVNGACLTVTATDGERAVFDTVHETLRRTTLGRLAAGARVNLEPALRVGDALDGHWVSGHIDEIGRVTAVRQVGEGCEMTIAISPRLAPLVAEKGSIAVDGVSLTVAGVDGDRAFTLALIPHTLAHTTLPGLRPGDGVNLEADLLARYAARLLGASRAATLDVSFLREHGFA